jgi:two-component system NarL family response regulator
MASQIMADLKVENSAVSQTDEPALTERQIEILRLVAQGLLYKEIGMRLFITERTVKYHMGEILSRLRMKSRQDAVEYAKRKGL